MPKVARENSVRYEAQNVDLIVYFLASNEEFDAVAWLKWAKTVRHRRLKQTSL